MASYIQSVPSMENSTLPTNAGSMIRGNQWGIDNLLSNWIIQSEDISRSVITDPTQDQKGALVSELDYDETWSLVLNVIGGTGGEGDLTEDTALPQVGDTTFSYANHKWKVDGVSYQGSFADKKKYTITAHRNKNFPAQT